jgi:intracellular septation protein
MLGGRVLTVLRASHLAGARVTMRNVAIELFKDFLSAIAFLIANALTHDIVVATGVAIAVALIQVGVSLTRRESISALTWLSLFLVLSLGSASLITADSRFIRFKPSLIHFAIAIVMLKRGWQLRYMPEIVRTWMSERELISWGYLWAVAMVIMGIANAAAAQWLDVAAWGLVLTGLLVAKIVLFGVQYASMRILIRRRIAHG